MTNPTIRFIRRGQAVTLVNVPPTRTLLEVLREDLGATGTKEGCGEGDCGACTVVLGEAVAGRVEYKAINACIRLAHSIDGLALWTVEDLTADPLIQPAPIQPALKPSRAGGGPGARSTGTGVDLRVHEDSEHRATTPPARAAGLHPVQQAMVQCHGSQCGFCTPGFVMSLFGLYQNQVCEGEPVTREGAQAALSGNLCRCTGYRPILDAAVSMAQFPPVRVNEPELLSKLEHLKTIPRWDGAELMHKAAYRTPLSLAELLALRRLHPQAQLVAGCTDVGLWVTKQHRDFAQVLDVTRVAELRRVERYAHHIAIGAAVTLADAFDALVGDRPQLRSFAQRFAGLPVRNSGTLGGNVANGSPIGDSMPLLIALGANVVLMRQSRGRLVSRELPLEQLYTGYRQNLMAKDEVLAWIKVPLPGPHPHPSPLPQAGEGVNSQPNTAPVFTPSPLRGEGWGEGQAPAHEFLRVYKISKRFEDDISAVCLAVRLQLEGERILSASIGVGGIAATPVRAIQTEAILRQKTLGSGTFEHAKAVLRAEFEPISDMRASAAYRREVLGNLLQRFWLESQGIAHASLETLSPQDLA
jgi:xanthine dehydrogenase small subunit